MRSTWAPFTCGLMFVVVTGNICCFQAGGASSEKRVSLSDDVTHSQPSAAPLQSTEHRKPPDDSYSTGGDEARPTSLEQSTTTGKALIPHNDEKSFSDSDEKKDESFDDRKSFSDSDEKKDESFDDRKSFSDSDEKKDESFDDRKSFSDSDEKKDESDKHKKNHNDMKKRRKTNERSSKDSSGDDDDDDDDNAAATAEDDDKKKNKGGRTRETVGVTFAVTLTVGVTFALTAVLVFLYCYINHRRDTKNLKHRSHGSACNTYSLPPAPVGSQPRPPGSSPGATHLRKARLRETISSEDVYELVDEAEHSYLHPCRREPVPIKKPRDKGVGREQNTHHTMVQRPAGRSDGEASKSDGGDGVNGRMTENHVYTRLHQPDHSYNALEHARKSAPEVVRLLRRRMSYKSSELLHSVSPASADDSSDRDSSVDSPSSAAYSLQKPVMEVYHRATADTADMAPADDRAYMIPTANTVYVLPADDGADMVPADDRADIAPADDRADMVPTDDRADMIPTADRAYVLPADDRADMVPTDDRAYMIPTADRVYVLPADDGADMVPADDRADIAPAVDRADMIPTADRAYVLPADDRADMVPVTDRTNMVPAGDRADMVPVTDRTNMVPAGDRADMVPVTDRTNMVPADDRADMLHVTDRTNTATVDDRAYMIPTTDRAPATDRAGTHVNAACEVYTNAASRQSWSCYLQPSVSVTTAVFTCDVKDTCGVTAALVENSIAECR